MSRHLLLATLTLSLSLLSGCSIFPKSQPLDVYQLPAKAISVQNDPALANLSLRVNTPQAHRLLGSSRIVVINPQNQVSTYQGVRWTDTATVLLRDRFIEAFQQGAKLKAVSSDSTNLQADYELVMELRAFQGEYHNGPVQAHIIVDVQLVQSGTQRILASQRFEVRQASAEPSIPSVIQALGEASDQLSSQLVNWTLAQAGKAQQH